MKNQSVPLVGGFYADDTKSWSAQDCVNWLPTQAEKEGTRTPAMLKTPPGLREFTLIAEVLTISGDFPGGYVGDVSPAFSYSSGGGVQPKIYAITAGSLPPGFTLASNGVIASATFTGAATSYSWTVQVTDATGAHASLNDGCTLTAHVWLAAYKGNSVNGLVSLGDGVGTWGAGIASNQYGFAYKNGSNLYISQEGLSNNVSISTDNGATWNTTGTTGNVSGGGGKIAFNGIYEFLCGGVNVMKRRDTGAWSEPSADTSSRANSVIAIGTSVICASIYSSSVSRSDDYGVTWTISGTFGFSSSSPVLGTNGARIVVAYDTSPNNTIVIKYSDDMGATWSAIAYTFPVPTSANYACDIIYTGTGWIVSTSLGAVAYSADGAMWTLSGNTIGVCNQLAVGGGAVLAACDGATMYRSNDNGATWTSITPPSTYLSQAINGIAWIS